MADRKMQAYCYKKAFADLPNLKKFQKKYDVVKHELRVTSYELKT